MPFPHSHTADLADLVDLGPRASCAAPASAATPSSTAVPGRRPFLRALPAAALAFAGWAAPSLREAGAAHAGAADSPAPPVYRTQAPESFEHHYDLRYAQISGRGLLKFARQGQSYRFDMQGTVLGMLILDMSSRGRIGPEGIIPERFSDRRKGKDALVATLDWQARQVRYSSKPDVIEFPPGTQDRLSWLVQVPAILLADPQRRRPGTRLPMFVTGARADAGVWTMVVQEQVDLNLASGRVSNVLHVARAPREPGDSRVEAWLDPARNYLPVQARMSSGDGSGSALELLLAP